jgi:hypothetical protein
MEKNDGARYTMNARYAIKIEKIPNHLHTSQSSGSFCPPLEVERMHRLFLLMNLNAHDG